MSAGEWGGELLETVNLTAAAKKALAATGGGARSGEAWAVWIALIGATDPEEAFDAAHSCADNVPDVLAHIPPL